ncbi:MAG: hypothetical protein PWQ59_441 [Thermoanaerobacterium sp.]|nr:hypothetical protein [Thermoanaerobacterium sp.]
MEEVIEKGTKDMKSEMARMYGKGYSMNSCYTHSFGPLLDKTIYVNPWQGKGFDMRDELRQKAIEGYDRLMLQKALGPESGGAGTAGYALVPVYVDPRIVDLSRKYTPLVELIPRVTNQGLTADYNVVTAKGGAFTAALDAELNETDDTYDRQSKSIKFLYAIGRILGPMQAAMPSYILEGYQSSGAGNVGGSVFSPTGVPNAKQLEVLMKARALKELEENLILNGDSGADLTEFDGIVKQQGAVNQIDLAGASLSWDDVEKAVRLAFDNGGRPKLAVGSSSVITDLRKIMIDTFRYSPDQMTAGAELPFGVPPQLVLQTLVGPIPCIPSMYLSNNSGSKQLWFLDTDFIEMRVLQDMTYEDLAKTNDSSKFMLKIYECLIVRAPQFNAYIDNIA